MAVSFINTFLSYLLLLLIIVVLAGIAVAVGITLRKRKDAKVLMERITEADNQ